MGWGEGICYGAWGVERGAWGMAHMAWGIEMDDSISQIPSRRFDHSQGCRRDGRPGGRRGWGYGRDWGGRSPEHAGGRVEGAGDEKGEDSDQCDKDLIRSDGDLHRDESHHKLREGGREGGGEGGGGLRGQHRWRVGHLGALSSGGAIG